MNQLEKVEFVKSLSEAIIAQIVENISILPDEWDGIELRLYIAEKFSQQVVAISKSRKAKYNNHVLVNDL